MKNLKQGGAKKTRDRDLEDKVNPKGGRMIETEVETSKSRLGKAKTCEA